MFQVGQASDGKKKTEVQTREEEGRGRGGRKRLCCRYKSATYHSINRLKASLLSEESQNVSTVGKRGDAHSKRRPTGNRADTF